MPESLPPLVLPRPLASISESPPPLRFRREPVSGDGASVRELASSTRLFSAEEVAVAVELVEARLAYGLASGYRFVFAEGGGRLAGYVCFGPIPLTRSCFDLYWIAVRPTAQGAGLGRRLMDMAEAEAAALGGTAMYVDTSMRPQYLPTRAFYGRLGYRAAAELPDFYAPGDGKAILTKPLSRA
jgi:ribosomal protein S18 acetylase RimI-like enzyme